MLTQIPHPFAWTSYNVTLELLRFAILILPISKLKCNIDAILIIERHTVNILVEGQREIL